MFKIIWAVIILINSSAILANTRIVVLGDSLSSSHGMAIEQGWVHLLQKKLQHTQQAEYHIINESISGETTTGGLARIDAILKQHKPSHLILELGANDGLRGLSPKLIKQNLIRIIQRCQQQKVRILLLSMALPPNYGRRYTTLFKNIFPQIAKARDVAIIPFVFDKIVLTPALIQADGLHPNAQAQPIILDKIWVYLKKMLSR
ncbi:MAG: arylesterase [Methylococcales bacterium]|nr:arylesterase [Methylococcales bacterium]